MMEKTKYFCLDVSGNMSADTAQMAIEHVIVRARKKGDFLLAFDTQVYGVWPVEEVLGKLTADAKDLLQTLCGGVKGRGGADPREALRAVVEHAQTNTIRDTQTVLISDGYMFDAELFGECIKLDDVSAT